MHPTTIPLAPCWHHKHPTEGLLVHPTCTPGLSWAGFLAPHLMRTWADSWCQHTCTPFLLVRIVEGGVRVPPSSTQQMGGEGIPCAAECGGVRRVWRRGTRDWCRGIHRGVGNGARRNHIGGVKDLGADAAWDSPSHQNRAACKEELVHHLSPRRGARAAQKSGRHYLPFHHLGGIVHHCAPLCTVHR